MKSLIFLVTFLTCGSALAGVFDLAHYIPEDSYSVGIDTELSLSNRAEVGAYLKGKYGLAMDVNLELAVGTGSENGYRMGSSLVWDMFPDAEDNVGLGMAFQGYYFNYKNSPNAFELSAVPYLHKRLGGEASFDPFVALPVGVRFQDGSKSFLAVAVGSQLRANESLKVHVEFGMNIHDSQTYFSGGVVLLPN